MVETKSTREEFQGKLTSLLDKLEADFDKPLKAEYLHVVMEAEDIYGTDFVLPYIMRYSALAGERDRETGVFLAQKL